MRRSCTALLSFGLSMAFGVAQAEPDSGFCISNLRALQLDPSALGEGYTVSRPDAGTAIMLCTNCEGLRSVEIFLGEDARGRGEALRNGSLDAEEMTASCLESVPNCSITTFTEGPSVGYSEQVSHSGLTQQTYRLFNGGQVLSVRATGGAFDVEWLSNAVRKVYDSVLKQVHC